MRATPLTLAGPQNLPAATAAKRLAPHNRWTKRRGPVTTNYSYDADGRETAAGSSSYSWNLANQMTSATVAGTTTNYTYDGSGMRTSASTGSSTINYRWDENDGSLPTLASEKNGSGDPLRTYLYGPSTSPAAMTTPDGSYYYSSDVYGNVADLTDSSGATQWAYQYEPFGQIRSATNVSGSAPVNPFQYAGQYTDTVTGLSAMRARNYDPTTGTFLSQDPAGASSPMATSWYAYANNNPLAYSDPSGLSSVLGDIYNAGVTALGDAANAVGDAATAVGQVVNTVVVQPTVQLAKTDYNCMTGNGGSAGACTAAAVQTGLLLLPGVDGIAAGADAVAASTDAVAASTDAVAASTSLFRASLRENASNIASAITDGVYKLATDESGEFNSPATLGRGTTEDTGSVSSQEIADTPLTRSVGSPISEAEPTSDSVAPNDSGADLAAEDAATAVFRRGGEVSGSGGAQLTIDEARAAAERNGIDTRSMNIQYGGPGGDGSIDWGSTSLTYAGPLLRGSTGQFEVTLYDAGLASEQDAVNTLAHELNHIRDVMRTGEWPDLEDEQVATEAGNMGQRYFRP